MMTEKQKKMIAPVVVSVVIILYYILYFCMLIALLEGIWKWLLGLIPIAFSVVTMMVCKERLEEIKRGEEDDLGQY